MPNIAIAGAGAVALTMAAHFTSLGHRVHVWSPSGQGTVALAAGARLSSSGEIEGEYEVSVVDTPAALCETADLLFVAITSNGQAQVLESLAPFIRDGQTVLVTGGALAFAGPYLRALLGLQRTSVHVGTLNGPFTGGRKLGPSTVVTPWIRSVVKLVASPATDTSATIVAASKVIGNSFVDGANFLALALTPGNAIYHTALSLGNITRMEAGEEWCGFLHTTESIGRLAEAMDAEKCTIGASFGIVPLSIADSLAGGNAEGMSVQQVMQPRTHQRTFRNGPRSVQSRYIEEEIPFGLATIEMLGRITSVSTPVITSTIDLFSIMRCRDYRTMNSMVVQLNLHKMTAPEIMEFLQTGAIEWPSAQSV